MSGGIVNPEFEEAAWPSPEWPAIHGREWGGPCPWDKGPHVCVSAPDHRARCSCSCGARARRPT